MAIGESVDMAGIRLNIQKVVPFENWVIGKVTTMNFFLKLGRKEKEKIFLLWKHGLANEDSNFSLELSNRWLYKRYKELEENGWLDDMNEGKKYYIKQFLWFERECLNVRDRIGLSEIRESNPMVNHLKDKFNAEEVND